MPDIAVYGLGEMGGDIARCITGRGLRIAAYDPVVDMAGESARLHQCTDAGEAARRAQVHLVVLKQLSHLESLLFDDGGLCRSAPPESLIVLHTTLTPAVVRDLHARVRETYGHALIDAALSRRDGRVSEGSLSLFLGGTATDVAAAKATLETYADNIVHAGPPGAGMIVKLCNNWLLYSNRNAALQALKVGRELGVEAGVLRTALAASTGSSWALAHYSELDEAIVAGRGAPTVVRRRTESELRMAREMATFAGAVPTSLKEAFALLGAM
ncbi:NAD(P)-dependent oxidoreductase [Streptomyces sioyaensis]|uniref:NAD(P)-dependent oxidoreductase n=1 Tax=Streptomyces sioyaensis TaxID=67364 RepID=UPI0037D54BA8